MLGPIRTSSDAERARRSVAMLHGQQMALTADEAGMLLELVRDLLRDAERRALHDHPSRRR